jgi:hypothetical protein
MKPMLTALIIYLWPNSVTSVYPVVEGFVENMEAIQHIEEVFDNAAKFAGAKVEEIDVKRVFAVCRHVLDDMVM